MSLTDDDREYIDAFQSYVEDFHAADDRYGPTSRSGGEKGLVFATSFEAGPGCWFQVTVDAVGLRVHVAFVTAESEIAEELQEVVGDSGLTLQRAVEVGFKEAGLTWADPPVEKSSGANGHSYFETPFDIDELGDLELQETRSKVVRMLEGYLIAFGPAVMLDDAGEDDDLE